MAEEQARAAQKAHEEAEKRAQAAGTADPEELRKAREQAALAAHAADEAMAHATAVAEEADRAKVAAEAKMQTERAARMAAEDRAKAESVQRLMQEQQSQERAESSITERVTQEIKAREEAERAADAKARTEAEARAQKSAAERKIISAETAASGAAAAPVRKKKNWALIGAVSVVVLIAAGLGLLHLIPLSGYVPGVQDLMSKRLGQPVSIGSMRDELYPASQLTLQSVTIGKLQEIKIATLIVPIGPVGLVSGTRSFDSVEANRVSVEADALRHLPALVRAPAAAPELQVSRIKLKAVNIAGRNLELPQFDADASFAPAGELRKATLTVDKARFEVTPKDKTWEVTLTASGWKPFIAPTIELDEIEATAVVGGNQATVSQYKGKLGGGAISGQFKVSWGAAIEGSGDMKMENGRLDQLMPLFTRNFSASGTLNLNATFTTGGASLKTIFDATRLEGTFSIAGGELNNIDVARALQAAKAGGLRGGKTRFETLAGTVQVNGNQYSYRQLQLISGALNAQGNVDVSDSALSGRINAEISTKSTIVARGGLSPGGTLRDPLLRP